MPQIHSSVSFDDIQTAFAHKSNQELKKTFWLYKMMNYPRLIAWGTHLLEMTLNLAPVKWLVRKTLFSHFVGGENLEDCLPSIQNLEKEGVYTYLSFSSEGKNKENAYEATFQETIRSIAFCKANPAVPFAVFKLTGMASFDLLEKLGEDKNLSALDQKAWEKLQERVLSICQAAYDQDVKLFIDAEETWIQDVIDQLADEMMERFNKEKPIIYNTYQMYRKAGLDLLKAGFEKAKEGNYFLGVKIVRGAYMEKERARAQEMNYPDPINDTKEASDQMYNEGLDFCLENLDRIAFCAGTHNEDSCYHLMQKMNALGIPLDHAHIFVGQLYGMSDNISYNMAKGGYNAMKYVPYGPVSEVMPYLFRRAAENTAIAGQSNREYQLVQKEIRRRKQKS